MKEILLAQFKATFDTAEWFVPLTLAIDGLNPQQASLTINQDNNSIGQIVAIRKFHNCWDKEKGVNKNY